MELSARSNIYRTTMVCADSYDGDVLAGRLYNPYLESGLAFKSLSQFLLQMENLLNQMNFPQSFTLIRTFAVLSDPEMERIEGTFQSGKLATFAIRTMFRQNASWQGAVKWVEAGKDESFRSTFELIMLMHSVLKMQRS